MVSERRTDFEKTDIVMLVLVVVLTVFGLAMLLSASEYNGRVRFGDSAYYFKKQLFAAALGLGIMYLIMNLDYHFFVKLARWHIWFLSCCPLLFFLWDRRSTVPEDG